jgi:hypothetical protein
MTATRSIGGRNTQALMQEIAKAKKRFGVIRFVCSARER